MTTQVAAVSRLSLDTYGSYIKTLKHCKSYFTTNFQQILQLGPNIGHQGIREFGVSQTPKLRKNIIYIYVVIM